MVVYRAALPRSLVSSRNRTGLSAPAPPNTAAPSLERAEQATPICLTKNELSIQEKQQERWGGLQEECSNLLV
jgi:hypothetical protein